MALSVHPRVTCARSNPGPLPLGAVDLDDWAVRRRRALWRAAGARAVGPAGTRGVGRVPGAVLLDMGGVVIPTLFESVAAAGFLGRSGGGGVRGRGAGGAARTRLLGAAGRAAARPGRGGVVAGLNRGCGGRCGRRWGALAGRVRLVAFTNDMAHWFGPDWAGGGSRSWPGSTRWWRRPAGGAQARPGGVPAGRGRDRRGPGTMPVRRRPGRQPGRGGRRRHADPAVRGPRPRRVGRRPARAAGHRPRPRARRGPAGCSASDELREGVRHPARALGCRRSTRSVGWPSWAWSCPDLRPKAGLYEGWVAAGELLFLSGQGADGLDGPARGRPDPRPGPAGRPRLRPQPARPDPRRPRPRTGWPGWSR